MFMKKSKPQNFISDIDALSLSLKDQSPFYVKEAINHLCINIMSLKEQDSNVFVVTSAGIGEGKTLISASVARALARINCTLKILFIDADLRSYGISNLIKRDDEQTGLSEYLSDKTDELNFVKTELDNFDILPSGTKMKNPASLFASPKMINLMNICKEKYDYVIIDSSPVGIVKDALLFAKYVDGYIITVRANKSKTNDINNVIDVIKGVNGNVIGLVLDSYDASKSKMKKNKKTAMEISELYSAE